jgi:LmbE family N-acetylglucosaminyl deacetylase
MPEKALKLVYLSPHLDDVALSCGGLVWEQTQAGMAVEIWSVCAGDPPPGELSTYARSLHARWDTGPEAIAVRQQEDIESLAILGATARHLAIPDVIYRRSAKTGTAYVNSDAELFGDVHLEEDALIDRLVTEFAEWLPGEAQVVCPVTLGHHIDHQIVRAAAERLGRPLWYYADYPYVLEDAVRIAGLLPEGTRMEVYPISAGGLQAWQACVAAHRSQISTFWPDLESMQAAIRNYCIQIGGVRLWHG